MQTIEREHTIKALNEGIENGNIVFNHPIRTVIWNIVRNFSTS